MPDSPIPVIVHLTGPSSGETRRISGNELILGSSEAADLTVPREGPDRPAAEHARLSTIDTGHLLRPLAGRHVWVNGQRVEEHRLVSGDLIELGEDGPLLRYRIYPAGHRGKKSFPEAFADAYRAARSDSPSLIGAVSVFFSGMLRDFRTQASPLARGVSFATVALLVAAVALLAVRSRSLEKRLELETRQIEGLSTLLESERTTAEDFEAMRRALELRIASADERLDFLEERAEAVQRTVAEASRAVVFLQGSYGFRVPATGRPLRFLLGADGQPSLGPGGAPRFTTEGEGPRVEAYFTGTGFVAGRETTILTNRHVALPWEFDEDARNVVAQGLEPYMYRFRGYRLGRREPFEVRLLRASEAVDLALLECAPTGDDVLPLSLEPRPPSVGDTVLVLGFPTGIQAMMARADREFLDRIAGRRLDFWEIANELSAAGQIGPLATRGIVGQASGSSVVYDAETTSGGSGGPVLDLNGRVVAINSAVLRQFGGSNLGVPAAFAVELIETARGPD